MAQDDRLSNTKHNVFYLLLFISCILGAFQLQALHTYNQDSTLPNLLYQVLSGEYSAHCYTTHLVQYDVLWLYCTLPGSASWQALGVLGLLPLTNDDNAHFSFMIRGLDGLRLLRQGL